MRSILEEALALVDGARQEEYGDPDTCYTMLAVVWRGMLAEHFRPSATLEPRQVALMIVAMKLCREMHKAGRDNRVDAVGYLEIADRLTRGEPEGI